VQYGDLTTFKLGGHLATFNFSSTTEL